MLIPGPIGARFQNESPLSRRAISQTTSAIKSSRRMCYLHAGIFIFGHRDVRFLGKSTADRKCSSFRNKNDGCGWSPVKSVTLGNVTMSHRRERPRMPSLSPLNYDRSAARAGTLENSA
ncbi:hypothetical protein EVAR_98348_1 [Eumeta japonica]|uniref:Uncharacterized protein n=1 Tax=Eumeta variegata TaxID=151549 RepID=A0A4C2AFI6_EUMVA|nr:hypothetical protein EVAR_98348_1 [Eumeta japonica]